MKTTQRILLTTLVISASTTAAVAQTTENRAAAVAQSEALIEQAFAETEPDVLPDEADTTAMAVLDADRAIFEADAAFSAEECDSLLSAWLNRNSFMVRDNLFAEMIVGDTLASTDSAIPDSVYIERLDALGSAIPFAFNTVIKRHIVAYTTTKRKTMGRIMGRSLYYFPMIEAELDAAGLPLELRMLPVVESALAPVARSPKGAQGLWQFMYGTGKIYGLEITSFIDQRNDPLSATKAACRFLKSLYGIFGDWNLAIAAYNCGPGNVNKAIRRAGGARDFWEIYPYLPRETRNYVPAFVAANYAYAYYKQHDITPEDAPLPLATDTIKVNRLLHFEQISSTISAPTDIIRALNPQYKLDIVPAVKGRSYSLVLPQDQISRYIEAEEQILAKDTTYMSEYLVKPKGKPAQFVIDSKTHVVRSGETLSGIAQKYGVRVSQIMKWNNIKNASKLRVGQRLEIFL